MKREIKFAEAYVTYLRKLHKDVIQAFKNGKRLRTPALIKRDMPKLYNFLETKSLALKLPFQEVAHLGTLDGFRPLCNSCHTPLHKCTDFRRGFSEFCSRECFCSSSYKKEKVLKTVRDNYGVDNVLQVKSIRKKADKTISKRYGVKNAFQSKTLMDKAKLTMVERFGVPHPMRSKEILESRRLTFLSKHGVDHPMKLDDVKSGMRARCLKRLGVDHHMKTQDSVNAQKNTSKRNWGFDSHTKSPEFQKKMRKLLKAKYGVEYVSQIPGVHEKQQNSYYCYDFELKGKTFRCRGYEHFGLIILNQLGFKVRHLHIGASNGVPSFKYILSGKQHIYFPDILINVDAANPVIVEIKSSYTAGIGSKTAAKSSDDYRKLKRKAEAVTDSGFSFWLLVLDDKGVLRAFHRGSDFTLKGLHSEYWS